jgi:ABC-type dipeptide/oligopeptide/nickel transport system permease component
VVRLVARKLLLMVLILALLNAVGFAYAAYHPHTDVPEQWRQTVSTDYPAYVRGVLSGDWGTIDNRAVWPIVANAMGKSLLLLLAATVIMALLGVTFGVVSVSRRTRRIKPWALIVATGGLSMPGFFLGVAIIGSMLYGAIYISSKALFLPLSGYGLDAHLILPILVLASRPTLQIARIVAGLLEHELQQDYVRVAQSKGLAWQVLFWQHAFPNVASAVAITVGQSMRILISSLIIVEALFLWPGIGRVFMEQTVIRIDGRGPSFFHAQPEYMALLAMAFGALLLVSDLLAGLLSYWLDPRLSRPANGSGGALA